MSKRKITFNEDTDEALREEHNKTGTPETEIIRRAVQMYFASKGKELNTTVAWGGDRKSSEKKED